MTHVSRLGFVFLVAGGVLLLTAAGLGWRRAGVKTMARLVGAACLCLAVGEMMIWRG